ncbi:hypothetical protein Tco_0157982 [Tanacetum coccineum]
MAAEVPQTLKYRGGQLNAAPLLEVENFTNWKKRFMCHITGVEPQFKNIIDNGPFIPMDFQDSLDDEEDARRSQEYMDDLEEEYQARALLAKSKRFFKKGFQRFSGAKYKPKLRPTKDFEAKYNKVKAKLALLSSSASALKSSMVKNKGLIAEAYDWDEEEVSSDDNEMVEVKVFMALADDNDAVSKEGARNGECSNKVNQCISEQIPTQKKRILGADQLIEVSSSSGKKRLGLSESQRNTIDPLVAVTDSFATDYDSADESSVCSTPIPPLEKLVGAEPISGPKTIKSILKSNSTFKAEALKGVIINEPSSAHAKGNKYEGTDHRTCDHAEYISTINMSQHLIGLGGSSSRSRNPRPSKHFFPPFIHCGFSDHLSDDCVNYPICDICGSYDHDTYGHNRIISIRRGIKPRNPQHCDIKKPIWYLASGCSRHMTGVKSSLHKYEKQPRPKVVFGDDSTCTTEGYGSIKCNGILFITFDEKRGTIFNSNKEVVKIAPRVRDVYVLDMTSSAQESCFFAKASENLNWLWHKRLAH